MVRSDQRRTRRDISSTRRRRIVNDVLVWGSDPPGTPPGGSKPRSFVTGLRVLVWGSDPPGTPRWPTALTGLGARRDPVTDCDRRAVVTSGSIWLRNRRARARAPARSVAAAKRRRRVRACRRADRRRRGPGLRVLPAPSA